MKDYSRIQSSPLAKFLPTFSFSRTFLVIQTEPNKMVQCVEYSRRSIGFLLVVAPSQLFLCGLKPTIWVKC